MAHARKEKHGNWKGDKVGYSGIHHRLRRWIGKPNYCEKCKTTEAKRFVWANKSQKNLPDFSDWMRLCDKCHKKYDRKLYGKTWFKKGEKGYWLGKKRKIPWLPKYKKGHIPWNKYLEKRICKNCKNFFQPLDAKGIFCKKNCYTKWQTGRKK